MNLDAYVEDLENAVAELRQTLEELQPGYWADNPTAHIADYVTDPRAKAALHRAINASMTMSRPTTPEPVREERQRAAYAEQPETVEEWAWAESAADDLVTEWRQIGW